MWVVPDKTGTDPGYQQLEIGDELLRGGLVPVASGRAADKDTAAIRIGQKDATLHAARIAPGAEVTLPTAPFVHLYVPQGSVSLEGTGLTARGRRGPDRGRAGPAGDGRPGGRRGPRVGDALHGPLNVRMPSAEMQVRLWSARVR